MSSSGGRLVSPFWSPELEETVLRRREARKKAEKEPTRENKSYYNKLTAQVRLLTGKTKLDKRVRKKEVGTSFE